MAKLIALNPGISIAITYIQEVNMKKITIKTNRINDKTIKALEQLGYQVTVILI